MSVLNKTFGASRVIQNPSNSPDLNVLDYHTWDHWDKMIQKNDNIKTLADLKREIVAAYYKIDMDEVKRAIDSWPKRLEKCLAAQGDRFEYAL